MMKKSFLQRLSAIILAVIMATTQVFAVVIDSSDSNVHQDNDIIQTDSFSQESIGIGDEENTMDQQFNIPFSIQILYQDDSEYVCQLTHNMEVLGDMSVNWFYLASDDPTVVSGEYADIFTIASEVRYRYSIGYDTGENYSVYLGIVEVITPSDEDAYINIESDGLMLIEYGIEGDSGGITLFAGYSTNPPAQPNLIGATVNSIAWKTVTPTPLTPAPGWAVQYRIRSIVSGSWGSWQSNQGTFTGLSAATGYECQARFTANNASTHLHSNASPTSKTIYTAPNPPPAPSVYGTPTTNSITVTSSAAPNGWATQYRTRVSSNGSWSIWQTSQTFNSLNSSTGYQFQARFTALDATSHAHSMESAASGTIMTATAAVPPQTTAAPGKPVVASSNQNSITINAAPTKSGWTAQYRRSGANSTGSWSSWQSSTQFAGLTAATGYYFQARYTANNTTTHAHSSESPTSDIIRTTSSLLTTTAPGKPVATSSSQNSITINAAPTKSGWTAQYRRSDANSAGSWNTWQNSTQFTGLTAGAGYYFQARYTANNTATHAHSSESPTSDIIRTTSSLLTTTAPGKPVATSSSQNSITINAAPVKSGWTAQYRRSGANSTSSWNTWQNSTQFTGLTAATGYYFQARYTANNTATHSHSPESPTSNILYTTDGTLTQPVVTVSGITSNSFTLSWNAVSGATGYQTSLDGVNWDNVSGTNKVYSNLVGATPYTAYVRAVNGLLTSKSVTTLGGLKQGTFMYAGQIEKRWDSQTQYYYDDKYFTQDATQYNTHLSTMSLCLELSSWSSHDASNWPRRNSSGPDKLKNARNLLGTLGFSAFDFNSDWEQAPTRDTIGVAAANKTIIDGSGKEYTLIALAIRGGGYYSEWGSNFNLGSSGTHAGFASARDSTLNFLNSYISAKNISGSIKLWMVGYSRAGAVSNITAGYINSNPSVLRGVSLQKKDLFCYTFEAPQGSTTSGGSDQQNIHNIVNVNDIVPLIAPSGWGFTRYNQANDHLLPYYATSNFGARKDAMLTQLVNLGYGTFGYNIKEYTRSYNRFGDSFLVDDRSLPQNELLAQFVDILSNEAIGSRSRYRAQLQEGIVEVMAELNAYQNQKMDALLDDLSSRLSSIILDIVVVYINPLAFDKMHEVKVILRNAVSESARNVGIDITDELLIALENTLFKILMTHPVLTIKVLDNAFAYGTLIQAHYPEITLAWVMSQDTYYNSAAMPGSAPKTTRRAVINCPVDIYVYDSNSTLVASIVNDIPQYQNAPENMIFTVNENGEKVIYLPSDEAYTIGINVIDSGTMTYSISEYDVSKGITTRLINYYELPIVAGESFSGIVPEIGGNELTAPLSMGTSADYALLRNSSTVVPISEEFTGEEIADEYYAITLSADNDSGTIVGGGVFLKGNYARIKAVPLPSGGFVGWYSGEQLVSTDADYRFLVMNDAALTAKFIPVEQHAIYFNATAGGSITSAEGLYSSGAITEIAAVADDGYVFVNWTSSNGGSFANANHATTAFTMPGNYVILTAHFSKSGGGVTEPEQPDGGLLLTPSLTEAHIGNSALTGLDAIVTTAYNGVVVADSALINEQTIEIGFYVKNQSLKIKSVQFILALHDANGNLVAARMQEAVIVPNTSKSINLSMELPQNPGGTMRVMLWDSANPTPHTCMTITE